MRIHEIINEAFQSSTHFTWAELDREYGLANFNVNEHQYAFVARNHGNVWEISFGNMVGSGKFSVTPTKNNTPFSVLSVIIAISKDFVAKVKPKRICFSTPTNETGARASVYTKLAKTLAAQYRAKVSVGDFEGNGTIQYYIDF
jgi:hypothetical protein